MRRDEFAETLWDAICELRKTGELFTYSGEAIFERLMDVVEIDEAKSLEEFAEKLEVSSVHGDVYLTVNLNLEK